MKLFSKNSSSETAQAGAKRDVTIVKEAPNRPTSVTVETDDARWTINLTLEEIGRLGAEFELLESGRGRGTEPEIMEIFIERMFQGSEGEATELVITLKPNGPGELSFSAKPVGRHGEISRPFAALKYSEVGMHVLRCFAEAQARPELVSDLIASLADEQE
jgi:hypothetical protein